MHWLRHEQLLIVLNDVGTIGMAGLEFMLKLSDLTLPPLIATHSYYTEYECVCLVHALFPGCLVLLQHVASAHYVDIDKYTLEAIEELTKHQLVRFVVTTCRVCLLQHTTNL